jgi:hypothetical protein
MGCRRRVTVIIGLAGIWFIHVGIFELLCEIIILFIEVVDEIIVIKWRSAICHYLLEL